MNKKHTYKLYDEILDEAPIPAALVYTAAYRLGKWENLKRCVIRAGPYREEWEGKEWNVETEEAMVVVKAPTKKEFDGRN